MEAVTQFEYVNQLNPDHAADLCLLGDAYFSAGQYVKAWHSYTKALQKDSRLVGAHAGLVHTYMAVGDQQSAIIVCDKALKQVQDQASRDHLSFLKEKIQDDSNQSSVALSE